MKSKDYFDDVENPWKKKISVRNLQRSLIFQNKDFCLLAYI